MQIHILEKQSQNQILQSKDIYHWYCLSLFLTQIFTVQGDGLCPGTSPACPRLPCGQNCLYELTSSGPGEIRGTHTTPVARSPPPRRHGQWSSCTPCSGMWTTSPSSCPPPPRAARCPPGRGPSCGEWWQGSSLDTCTLQCRHVYPCSVDTCTPAV